MLIFFTVLFYCSIVLPIVLQSNIQPNYAYNKKKIMYHFSFTITLREEILAGRKFGGFGGFCPKPPN